MTCGRLRSISKSERGAAMLAALCLAMVFALCLTSFVALSYTSLTMSTRNVMSSHGIELAEAGLEDGLYLVNNTTSGWSAWPIVGGVPTVTLPTFTLENGLTATVKVWVNNSGTTSPTFFSEATVNIPNGRPVKRELQATGVYVSSFTNAMGTTPGVGGATSGKIIFMNGGTVDSYNSILGSYGATVGSPGVANKGYSAVLLSQLASGSAGVQLGNNSTVDGYVVGTAPTPESYGSGSSVLGPNTPVGVSVDPSRTLSEGSPIQQAFNENFPSSFNLLMPAATNLSGNSTLVLGNPLATVPTSYLVLGDLNLAGNAQVTIQGPVILIVEGQVNIQSGSTASIAIAPTTGAGNGGPLVSLEMHAFGNVNIDGGGVSNLTQSPERVLITSSWNSSGTIEMGTTTPFYGVINFPNNSITFNHNNTIFGAVVANSVKFNNTPAFHYDTYLQNAAPWSTSFLGPLYNAFTTFGSGNNATHAMTVSGVTEVLPAL